MPPETKGHHARASNQNNPWVQQQINNKLNCLCLNNGKNQRNMIHGYTKVDVHP